MKIEESFFEGLLKKDQRTTKRFFDKYSLQVHNFVRSKINNPRDQEEVLQEIFISAFQSLPTLRSKEALSSWLLSIAHHEVADFYRKRKIKTILFSHLPFLENLMDEALGPEEKAVEEDLKKKIKMTFENLNEGYRIILRLKYIEGCSVNQIARTLNLSLKAVESRLTRARVAFREAWSMEYLFSNENQQNSKRKISDKESF